MTGLSFAGHIAYGAHQAFPSACLYLTLIREPVARVISQYRLLHSLQAFSGSLAEFIDSGWLEAENYQVRCLTLTGWSSRQLPCDALDQAKANLLEHTLFSVTEELPVLFEKLHHRFGWPLPAGMPRLNRTVIGSAIHCGGGNRFRDVQDLIQEADLQRLAAMNELDTGLYQFAREHLRTGLPA